MNVNTQSVLAPVGIKNIIFDLGGVIINLAVEKTHQAFANLSGLPVAEIKTRVHHVAFFHEFEKGLITDPEFRDHLRESLTMKVIFLDDYKDNLVGANKAGIQTFHVEYPDQIFSLFA